MTRDFLHEDSLFDVEIAKEFRVFRFDVGVQLGIRRTDELFVSGSDADAADEMNVGDDSGRVQWVVGIVRRRHVQG